MTAAAPLTTYRGVVYPAQCDAMGHMNVQYYVAAFDQAMWHLVLWLGFKPSWPSDRGEGWADVRYVIEFRRELSAGRLFSVESTVTQVGNTSLGSHHRLLESDSGKVAAEIEMTSVYFDLRNRASRALPDDIRAAAQRVLARASTPDAPGRGE